MLLQRKTAFVSGGSTGIGFAIAKDFVLEGVNVVIFARNQHKLTDALHELKQHAAQHQKIEAFSLDVTDNEAVKNCFNKVIENIGAPDILINCVGIAQPHHFEQITYASFDKTIHANLYSMWNTIAAALPHMKKNGGHIINTSSIAGYLGVYGYTDYCMTKFGIIGFSEALRQELHQYNIKVSILCPPDTDTPGLAEENKTKPEETKAIGGKAKLMEPEEVSKAVIKALKNGDKLILPGFDSKITWILKRFFPGLAERIMMSAIKKVQKQRI